MADAYKILGAQVEGSQGLKEVLEWRTELSKARDETERARQVRAYPRYRLEYSVPAHDEGSRAVLSDLRTWSGDWLVPLWPHVAAGAALPRAMSDEGRLLCLMADGSFVAEAGAPNPAAIDTIPAGLGRLVDVARIQHTTENLAVVRLAFQLNNYREIVEPWSGSFLAGLPVFDFDADWSAPLDEEVARVGEWVDNDITAYEHVRYLERRQTATIVALGDAEIRRFRAFLFHCAGRFGRFYAQFGADAGFTGYRLDADAIELLYRLHPDPSQSYVTARLAFHRLG